MLKYLVSLILALTSYTSHASHPAIAATLNGEAVYLFSLQNRQILRSEKTPISQQTLLKQLLTERLLATQARAQYSAAQLHPASRIGFARNVAIEDRLASSLRAIYGKEIDLAVQALPSGTLKSLYREESTLAQQQALFGGKAPLEYTLKPAQLEHAKTITLIRYQLSQPGSITLYDIYQRQNVQGRIELFALNQAYLNQQVQIAFANLFTIDWAVKKFGQATINDYRRSLADQEDAEALMKIYGIGDQHERSDYLAHLAKQSTPAEIARYYQQHKDQFKRIAKVKARHIRVKDEALAKALLLQLKLGEDFASLARQHSIASTAENGGDLGWIKHQGTLNWVEQIAFSQRDLSQAFRAPVGPDEAASWEIVKVEQRVEEYQAPDSESVRYAASAQIALQKSRTQFHQLLNQQWQKAKIEVNPAIGKLDSL